MSYSEVAIAYEKISTTYRLIDIFEVQIGSKDIKIKILQDIKNPKGCYYYRNSHWYYGSEQATPYISSRNGFETKEEALQGALKELTSFYKEYDKKAVWAENKYF